MSFEMLGGERKHTGSRGMHQGWCRRGSIDAAGIFFVSSKSSTVTECMPTRNDNTMTQAVTYGSLINKTRLLSRIISMRRAIEAEFEVPERDPSITIYKFPL